MTPLQSAITRKSEFPQPHFLIFFLFYFCYFYLFFWLAVMGHHRYPNLKTACHIKLKLLLGLWTKLLENLLLEKYLISVTEPLTERFSWKQNMINFQFFSRQLIFLVCQNCTLWEKIILLVDKCILQIRHCTDQNFNEKIQRINLWIRLWTIYQV